jgi:hypothetical protein
VSPIPTTAKRTVSLGPSVRVDPSVRIMIPGIPSAKPAVVELLRKFLRVIGFICPYS